MSRSRMAWGVVLYSMWARSSWPQRSQRQRSGRGQRTSKPWPSWWRSYPVISTPEGKSISIVTLATVYHLVGAAGPISMPSSRTPWGSETGMITPESASDQVPRKSSVSHLKTEEPTVLDSMRRLGHPRQFRERGLRGGIRQIVIKLVGLVGLKLAGHEQQLLWPRAPRRRPRLHPPLQRLDHQRTLLAVAHLDRGPGAVREPRATAIQPRERALGTAATPGVFRRRFVEVAGQRVRRDRQQVALAAPPQIPAETRRPAHLVVPRHPSVRQERALLVEHLQRQPMASAELDLPGHPRSLAARAVRRPLVREIKACIDDRMFLPRDVPHVEPDLAVLDLAESTAPLSRHAHRLGPLLGDRRGVEDDHAIRLAEVGADLAGQRHEQGLMVPRNIPDELLEALTLPVVEVGDPLGRLVFEFRQQAGEVLDGVPPLFGLGQGRGERLDELLQPCQQALGHLRGDLRLGQQAFQLQFVTAFHDILIPCLHS